MEETVDSHNARFPDSLKPFPSFVGHQTMNEKKKMEAENSLRYFSFAAPKTALMAIITAAGAAKATI